MAEPVESRGAEALPEPLGAQLVSRGLITEEQLTVALDEQRVSGGQIGAILVRRGFVTPVLVAQALATQQGRLLKTEYGFAMGFGQTVESPGVIDEPPVSVHLSKSDATVAIVAAAPPADPETDRAAVRAELELASGESMRLRDANERLAALRVELEQSLAHESQRAAALERELAALREEGPAGGEAAALWQVAHANVEQSLGQWQAAYAELEQRFTQATEQVAALEQRFTQATEQLAALGADLASRDASLEELRASASTCESVRSELELALANEVRRGLAVKEEFAAAEQRFVAAEAAQSSRRELEQQLEQVAARAAALEDQVSAAEKLRASVAASEQARSGLELRLEQAAEQLREAETVRSELEARLAAAAEQAAGLESEAADADELRRSALASEQAVGELERHLDAVRLELKLRTSELEAARAAAQAGPWADALAHLVFFQGADGYQLAERDGPPPRPGAPVDLEGLRPQIVVRIARSPFPGDALPCAYLSAA